MSTAAYEALYKFKVYRLKERGEMEIKVYFINVLIYIILYYFCHTTYHFSNFCLM